MWRNHRVTLCQLLANTNGRDAFGSAPFDSSNFTSSLSPFETASVSAYSIMTLAIRHSRAHNLELTIGSNIHFVVKLKRAFITEPATDLCE